MALDAATEREVESFVADWLADAEVPGAAVAVVDEDEIRYAEGFGARDLASNEPATPRTLFGVGSITKSVTALAVMQLVEDGDLSVDDEVDEYVDHYADVDGDPITVADLLTHTSGMPSDGSGVVLIARKTGLDPMEVPVTGDDDFRRHVQAAADDRLTEWDGGDADHDGGDADRDGGDADRDGGDADRGPFFYYNSGYSVLGKVVEELTGQQFADFVGEQILDPLGMSRSTFSPDEFHRADDRMTPYFPDDGESVERSFPFDQVKHAPGGLVSSAEEMATYLRMQMNGGSLGETELLDADAVEDMHTPRSTRTRTIDGTEEGYGYGWMLREYLGDTLVGHGGSVAVSTAYAGFLAEAGLGVVVLCNTTADPHPMHVGPAVLAILRGADPYEVEPAFALERKLDPLTGEYASHREIAEATVERRGGTLSLTLSAGLGEQELSLVPTSLDPGDKRFEAVTGAGNREPVRFEETGDGHDLFVQRWRLHGE